MKRHLQDALIVVLAVIFTGSTAYAMQPQPATQVPSSPVMSVGKPLERPTEPAKEEPKPVVPEVTWRDNPQGCNQETQWIDENPPFACIDKPVPTASVAPVAAPSASPSGTCEQWMVQAGVPINAASRELIINESGCRPDAVNPSSGACGIPQALPCSKLPCTLSDPVCQLRWMQAYVVDRYTTWEGALAFWHCIGYCSNNYGTVYKTATWY